MGVGVGLGLAEFPFAGAKGYWEWVELCETRGVDSIWQIDRLTSKEPFLECMTTMAALAGATKKLKFGMNVASAGLRDPLLLAKQCATVDMLSNGRLLPAFGIGSATTSIWEATNRPTKARGKRTDEALELIQRLWTEKSVNFDGEFYKYTDACIEPKPVQKRIPFWLGGSSPAAVRRTARFGTGWLAGLETPAIVGPVIADIKVAAKAAGRPIPEDHFGASFPFRFGSMEDPSVRRAADAFEKRTGRNAKDYFGVGSAEDIIARLHGFVSVGAYKFVLRPISDGDEDTMHQTKLLIDEVLPAVHARDFAA
jgi:probable F420-dependent oxidoreductase